MQALPVLQQLPSLNVRAAQVQLATTFHKVLQVPLPSWPCSQDSLTVWKRTTTLIADGAQFGPRFCSHHYIMAAKNDLFAKTGSGQA
jgi:hypothetical protein